MTQRSLATSVALLVAAAAAQAGGVVNVTFVEPEKFYDAGNDPSDRAAKLKEIERSFHHLGKRYLDDGQVLDVQVTNVDLAGYAYPTVRGNLRIVRGRADWPSFDLRYTLTAGGQTLKSGQEHVADLDYARRTASNVKIEPLRYEKRMLDAWFRERFAPPQ